LFFERFHFPAEGQWNSSRVNTELSGPVSVYMGQPAKLPILSAGH
jgi:hypothetical protein